MLCPDIAKAQPSSRGTPQAPAIAADDGMPFISSQLMSATKQLYLSLLAIVLRATVLCCSINMPLPPLQFPLSGGLPLSCCGDVEFCLEPIGLVVNKHQWLVDRQAELVRVRAGGYSCWCVSHSATRAVRCEYEYSTRTKPTTTGAPSWPVRGVPGFFRLFVCGSARSGFEPFFRVSSVTARTKPTTTGALTGAPSWPVRGVPGFFRLFVCCSARSGFVFRALHPF